MIENLSRSKGTKLYSNKSKLESNENKKTALIKCSKKIFFKNSSDF